MTDFEAGAADRRFERMDAWLKRVDEQERARRRSDRPPRRSWPAPPLDALLAFEEQWPGHAGGKYDAIRNTFGGMSTTRYYQVLNAAINTREALELNPILVRRLREQRDARTAHRAARTFPTRGVRP